MQKFRSSQSFRWISVVTATATVSMLVVTLFFAASSRTDAASPSILAVSNLEQPRSSTLKLYTGDRGARFQAFTTGDDQRGYVLRQLQMQIHPAPDASHIKVSVLDNDEADLFDLDGPFLPEEIYLSHFTHGVSDDHVLNSATTYKLAFRHQAAKIMMVPGTASAAEDAGAATGWQIADNSGHLGESGQEDLPDAFQIAIWAEPYLRMSVPGSPRSLTGEPGHKQVTLRWDAPDGTPSGDYTNTDVTHYEYRFKTDDDYGTWTVFPCNYVRECPIRGLEAGTSHTFQVRAANERIATDYDPGAGPESDELAATPLNYKPAPTPTPTPTPAPPPPPLTGEFVMSPERHVGKPLQLAFRFSEDVHGLSWRTVRDGLFEIRGGEISRVKRNQQGSNQEWQIWIAPDSAESDICVDVKKGLPECGASGSVCTTDHRSLSFVPHLAITHPRD